MNDVKVELSKFWKKLTKLDSNVYNIYNYVLFILFYRFISENITNYIEGLNKTINYINMSDDTISIELKENIIKTKGYFLYPSQLFKNIANTANFNENLTTDLVRIFSEIEKSINEDNKKIKGIFTFINLASDLLGNSIKEKNLKLLNLIDNVNNLNLPKFEDTEFDIFGDLYEIILSDNIKSLQLKGEFFTPQKISELVVKIASIGNSNINRVYDPTMGSGSLLLQAKKQNKDNTIEIYGQEINPITYYLACMNILLNNVNYDNFDLALGDTLTDPEFFNGKSFDIVISNPPYSVKWSGSDNSDFINDKRFSPTEVLAPKSKADFAFLLHGFHFLGKEGTMAIILPHGVLFRGGAEERIRSKLLKDGNIDTVIGLPANLFFSTGIPVCILVLKKCKKPDDVLFINASEHFEKGKRQNKLTDEHIAKIVSTYQHRKEEPRYSRRVSMEEIEKNDYNLNISRYISTASAEENIDLQVVHAELVKLEESIETARSKHNAFLDELGLPALR